MRVGEKTLDRLRSAADEAAEGLAITQDIVRALRSRVQGIQITSLHGSPGAIERLLATLPDGTPA